MAPIAVCAWSLEACALWILMQLWSPTLSQSLAQSTTPQREPGSPLEALGYTLTTCLAAKEVAEVSKLLSRQLEHKHKSLWDPIRKQLFSIHAQNK